MHASSSFAGITPPKTGIPSEMAAERSGEINPSWLRSLPLLSKSLAGTAMMSGAATPLPSSTELWQAPGQDALELVAATSSYFDILRYVREHGYFFLIPKALVAEDAPLPHVAYEDIMHALTTCSMQRPPEEQFQLPPGVLRLLLCSAAHHVLHCKDYFATVEAWFRRQVERQQTLGSEAWSAWVMCCAAAARVDLAILFLEHMQHSLKLNFDPVVFNYLMHPSEVIRSESGAPDSTVAQLTGISKGFIQQQRIVNALQIDAGTVAVGVHAIFVFYAITQQRALQWETIRVAAQHMLKFNQPQQQQQQHKQSSQYISARTMKLMKSVFKHERGSSCGPLTCRTLVHLFASDRDLFHTCLVLTCLREREVAEEVAVPVKFSRDEQRHIMRFFLAEFDGGNEQQQQQQRQDQALSASSSSSSFPSLDHHRQQQTPVVTDEERLHLPLLDRLLRADHTDPIQRAQVQLRPLVNPAVVEASESNGIVVGRESSSIAAAVPNETTNVQQQGNEPSRVGKKRKAKLSPELDEITTERKAWRQALAATPERPRTLFFNSRADLRAYEMKDAERAFGGTSTSDPADAMAQLALRVEHEKAQESELLRKAQQGGWMNPDSV